jgi:hypothetical protein
MSTSQTSLRSVAPENGQDASVLTSWKDIARYVGRSVRTVQRWERELGFPVRRTKTREKGSVLAIPREIDSWVETQQFMNGSDRATTLLQSLHELRSENRELLRQLAIKQAKVEQSHGCWIARISNDGLLKR